MKRRLKKRRKPAVIQPIVVNQSALNREETVTLLRRHATGRSEVVPLRSFLSREK